LTSFSIIRLILNLTPAQSYQPQKNFADGAIRLSVTDLRAISEIRGIRLKPLSWMLVDALKNELDIDRVANRRAVRTNAWPESQRQ
jgi:hypothetical protein